MEEYRKEKNYALIINEQSVEGWYESLKKAAEEAKKLGLKTYKIVKLKLEVDTSGEATVAT